MKKMKRVLSLALTAALSLSMVSYSSAEEQKANDGEVTTITFALWDEVQSVVYQQLIDKFEEQNPDIKVEMQLTPWDQYWTKFEATAGTDEAPDTYFMNAMWERYTQAGIMEPLNDYVEKDGLDLGMYTPALVDFFTTSDGTLGCLPKGMDSIAVACNKTIFDQYGIEIPTDDWTWDDMIQICADLKAASDAAGDDVYPMALALNSINSSWGHIMFEFGGSMFEDGKCVMDSPENLEAFTEIMSMIDNGYIPDYTMICDTTAEDLYISGKAAMLYLPTFSSQKVEQSTLEGTVLVTLPKAATKEAMLIGMGYGMSATGEHKDESWRFIKYLGSEEAAEIIAKSGIDMPSVSSMQEYYKESFTKFDGKTFSDQLAYTKSFDMGPVSAVADTESLYIEYAMKIFTRELSPEDGLKEMNEMMDAAVADN